MRIIPVKVDRSLFGIIRTYILIYILNCSTKPLVFFSISFERKSVDVFFTSILRSHKCETNYTRFHAFRLSSTLALMWWRKKTVESSTLYNSCTSIWVRIKPVKLHWSLTGIIRIYIIIYILYCSRKPLVFLILV